MRVFSRSISARFVSFFILGFLVAGVAALPVRGLAQQPAPAAATAPAEPATSSAKGQEAQSAQAGEVKKEEKKEAIDENVYRHTKLVTFLAKVFGLDVETTARLFEIVNFLIIVLAIGIPLVKTVPKVIRRRSQTLSHELEEARKTTSDANTRLAAVEAQLSRLDEEIAKIRTQVEVESKDDEARIKASMQEESARITASAEQEINAAAAHAQRELRHFAADLAIEQAAKQLVFTPEMDRALIAEFVKGAANGGSDGAAKGGQN